MNRRNKIINIKNGILLSFVFIFIFGFYSWIDIRSHKSRLLQENLSIGNEPHHNYNENKTNIKYILQWTDPNTEPFAFMGKGQDTFLKSNCPVNNCYITANRSFLKELTNFDAILFHGPELNRDPTYVLPETRLPSQKYIFASMESSHYYPIIQQRYENFFNWTWTYKLNSDLLYEYIKIRNKRGDVIGPNQTMNWLKVEEMDSVDNALKHELNQKNLFAAWFVSNCHSMSKREFYVKNMENELKKINTTKMTIDVFGKCGRKKCPRTDNSYCTSLVKKSYYFYLSFENSFAEDYVTEKLLTALQNNAVPVVFGGADYSRFMPDSAYLDARKLSPEQLVRQMLAIINDTEKYYDFFRWKKYYTYHDPEESAETNHYCRFCSKINSETDKFKVFSYSSFRKWWNK